MTWSRAGRRWPEASPCRQYISPFIPMAINLAPEDLHKRAKKAQKRRAPGLDGWTMAELAKLPARAWGALLRVLSFGEDAPFSSMLGTVRRVALDKGTGGEVTPAVDIYSGVVRIASSAKWQL